MPLSLVAGYHLPLSGISPGSREGLNTLVEAPAGESKQSHDAASPSPPDALLAQPPELPPLPPVLEPSSWTAKNLEDPPTCCPVANDRAPSEESNPSSSMEADGADNTNKRNETWLLALHAVTACCIAVAAPAVMVAIPFIAAPFVASPSASQFFRHATLTCRA